MVIARSAPAPATSAVAAAALPADLADRAGVATPAAIVLVGLQVRARPRLLAEGGAVGRAAVFIRADLAVITARRTIRFLRVGAHSPNTDVVGAWIAALLTRCVVWESLKDTTAVRAYIVFAEVRLMGTVVGSDTRHGQSACARAAESEQSTQRSAHEQAQHPPPRGIGRPGFRHCVEPITVHVSSKNHEINEPP